ncbi:MAG: GNAT family N-acetyltransferase [Stagnimonas sp.]|nr:GNAT family N-acetyltransferase [Stagnimonas sp.]
MAEFLRERNGYTLSDDPARLDLAVIHGFLRDSYWANSRSEATQTRANQNSLCIGLYRGAEQVGFARVISDYASFAYLCDVFVLEAHRGRGLGDWLIAGVQAHPRLQGLRRWSLATRDAHGLYARHGWTPLPTPEIWMQKFDDQANPA